MADREPPLADYDNLSTGSVESRARALDEQGLRDLLDYERQHADRIQIVRMLEHRLEALRSGEATPSDGDPSAPAPEAGRGEPAGPQVTPATQGPPQNPPSQGVPTNPAQPRG